MAGCADEASRPDSFRVLQHDRFEPAVLDGSAPSLDARRCGTAVATQQRRARQRVWSAASPADLASAADLLFLMATSDAGATTPVPSAWWNGLAFDCGLGR